MDIPANRSRRRDGSDQPPSESTSVLLHRVRSGDEAARERLFARVLPALQRWAHRRLPAGARDLHDTDDLVQVSLARAFHRLDGFESRGQGAFLAYVRQILLNAIRDEIRRAVRLPGREELPEEVVDRGPSALETAVGRDTMESYEHALATLHPDHQEAVIMRIELDLSYQEIAEQLAMPSADAARKMIGRALLKLAEHMREHV
jgi:RNA polymerase sigma-70 factor (ECF subfamily)